MANICTFDLTLDGEYLNILEALKHFHEGYEGRKVHRTEIYKITIENNKAILSGGCAWAVVCCMMDDKYFNIKEFITLAELSKDYSLNIKVDSIETGMEFIEKISINNEGQILREDCIDIE